MPETDRLTSLLRRGRQAAQPPAEEEPPAGSTPKGLFLRKFRPKPAGAPPDPKPLPPDGKDATNEKAIGPHSLEQEPVGQTKETGIIKGAVDHPPIPAEIRASKVVGRRRKPAEASESPQDAPKASSGTLDVVYSSRKRAWPLALLKQLHADFGWEWLDWEPEALWEALGKPQPVVRDIVGALRTLFKSEAFWNEFHIFLWTCQALNGRPVDMRLIPELDPSEIMYGVLAVEQIRGQKKLKMPNGSTIEGAVYSPEVLATIAAAFRVNGYVYVPPPVEGATSLLLEQCDASVEPLSRRVAAAWPAIERGDQMRADESPFGVQVQHLQFLREYTKELRDE